MTRDAVFVDTGAWFAIADRRDQFHAAAKKHVEQLTHNAFRLLTTNAVVQETAMLLARKVSKTAAMHFLDTVDLDDRVEVIRADEALEQEGYAIFKSYREHDFSITDCISFAVMKDRQIKNAFTFDKHFRTMRFLVEPPV
jgi:predicted nucleic acid-binding protein